MKLALLPWSLVPLLLPLAAACDPGDEGPPPMTAQGAGGLPPPPAPLPAPPPPAGDPGAAQDPSSMYASPEVAVGADTDAYDDNDPAALSDFRPALDAHGTWSDDPTYGTVWTPSPAEVGAGFTPYATAGHWVYDDDYTWVSDYDWGWAPYHYGRWVFIEGRGWAWVPGREYRGAWVGWGVDDGYGYVGWYPLAPPFLWFGGVAVGYGFAIGPRWNYCGRGDVFSPVVGTRVVSGPAAASIAGRVHAVPSVGGGMARGPEPSRLGYSAAQIPHASGAAAAGLARAQQFARPSTATALGAHAATPSRAPGSTGMGGGSRPSLTGGSSSSLNSGLHGATPGAAPQQAPKKKRPPEQSGPAPHHSSGGHSGGGHHR